MRRADVIELINKFSDLKVLVYGDYVLDEFLYGRIERISREAPVFIITHEESDFRPGCAANAVANLAALGATVLPCGIVGDDENGITLRKQLGDLGADAGHLLASKGIKTALKTRIIAGGVHSLKQQIVRIDRLNGSNDGAESDEAVRREMGDILPGCNAVLISDYGIGGLKLDLALWLMAKARKLDKPVLVDSRYRLTAYAGATAMTPNHPEAESAIGRMINTTEELHVAGAELVNQLKVEALVITRGSEGMTLFRNGTQPHDIPAYGDDEEVVDVTGAGDTVIATFALAVAAGGDYLEAAQLANIAGGLTVLKKGTSTISQEELLAALGKGGH